MSEQGNERAVTAGAAASLGLQFLLELAALGALAYWGFETTGDSTRWLLGLGAPALAIAFWALFGAPRAPRHAYGAGRIAVEFIFFGVAVLALAVAGAPVLGTSLGALVVANIAVLRRLGQDG